MKLSNFEGKTFLEIRDELRQNNKVIQDAFLELNKKVDEFIETFQDAKTTEIQSIFETKSDFNKDEVIAELNVAFENRFAEIKNRIDQSENKIEKPPKTKEQHIDECVQSLIRKKYSDQDEKKLLLQGISNNQDEDFLRYTDYVKQCIQWGEVEKQRIPKGGEAL